MLKLVMRHYQKHNIWACIQTHPCGRRDVALNSRSHLGCLRVTRHYIFLIIGINFIQSELLKQNKPSHQGSWSGRGLLITKGEGSAEARWMLWRIVQRRPLHGVGAGPNSFWGPFLAWWSLNKGMLSSLLRPWCCNTGGCGEGDPCAFLSRWSQHFSTTGLSTHRAKP